MEDEIDLRQYISVLLRHWKLIVIVTVLAGAAALAVSLLTPQVYEAKSRVSIQKAGAVLLPNGTLQEWSPLQAIPKDFADMLLYLAKSNAIAEAVADEAAANFQSAGITAGSVLGAVQSKQQGNSIEFSVRYSGAAEAAFIANAWAHRYQSYVDNYFRTSGQTPQEASIYADSIKKIYMEKQKALLDFEASGKVATTIDRPAERDIQLMELTAQRDASLKAYQAAQVRISDAEIAQATSGGYVRVADKSVTPEAPLPDNKKWLNTVVALIAGLIVGVIGAFAVEYFSKTAARSAVKHINVG